MFVADAQQECLYNLVRVPGFCGIRFLIVINHRTQKHVELRNSFLLLNIASNFLDIFDYNFFQCVQASLRRVLRVGVRDNKGDRSCGQLSVEQLYSMGKIYVSLCTAFHKTVWSRLYSLRICMIVTGLCVMLKKASVYFGID